MEQSWIWRNSSCQYQAVSDQSQKKHKKLCSKRRISMSNNSTEQIRKKLYEKYVDNIFRLVMNHVAEWEGKLFLEENEKLKNDPEFLPSARTLQRFSEQLEARLKKERVYNQICIQPGTTVFKPNAIDFKMYFIFPIFTIWWPLKWSILTFTATEDRAILKSKGWQSKWPDWLEKTATRQACIARYFQNPGDPLFLCSPSHGENFSETPWPERSWLPCPPGGLERGNGTGSELPAKRGSIKALPLWWRKSLTRQAPVWSQSENGHRCENRAG